MMRTSSSTPYLKERDRDVSRGGVDCAEIEYLSLWGRELRSKRKENGGER